MPKRKVKTTSDTEDLPPPLLRSLRSKKREHPYEEVCLSADICTTSPQQDTGINATTSAASLQILESSVQGCTKTAQLEEGEEHTITSKQEGDVEDKSSMAVSVCAENVIAGTVGETVMASPCKDFQLKNLKVVLIKSIHNNEGDEKEENKSKSPTHSPTNQSQPFQPASQGDEIGDAACPNVCEEQQCTGENMDQRMEKSQESKQVPPNRLCIDDERAAAVGLPAKKRRRMGTCGMTEKERSHFFQAQNRENTKSCRDDQAVRDGGGGQWTVTLKKDDPCQGCDDETDLVTEDRILPSSAPPTVGRVTEHWEMETQRLSGYCSREDRADTEVHVSMTTSDMISNALNQAGGAVSCPEGESHQADPNTEPGPGLVIDKLKNDESAESKGGLAITIPVIGEEQELEEATDETCERLRKEMDDGCGGPDCYSAITVITATAQNAGIETGHQEDQTLSPQRESVARDASMEAVGDEAVHQEDADGDRDGAEARVPSTETGIGGFSGGTEEPYEVAATPSGSEENENGPQTRTTSPFGSWSLSYISDSQLNNTVIEKEVVERDEGPGSVDCHEDATEVVCGMIKELAALNWMVMVAQEELENFDCDPCSD